MARVAKSREGRLRHWAVRGGLLGIFLAYLFSVPSFLPMKSEDAYPNGVPKDFKLFHVRIQDDVTIEVLIPEDPTLLSPGQKRIAFVHGFPDNVFSFNNQLVHFLEQGAYPVAISLRGYMTDRKAVRIPTAHISAIAKDIQLCLETLSLTDEPVHLVGHDWGAIAAQAIVRENPSLFASLTLVSVPPLDPPTFLPTLMRHPTQLLRSWYIFFFISTSSWAESWLVPSGLSTIFRTWGLDVEMHADRQRGIQQSFAKGGAAMVGNSLQFYRDNFPFALGNAFRTFYNTPIPLPTLVVHGRRDGCILPSIARGAVVPEHFPRGAVLRVIDAGHFLHQEAPRTFNALVEDHMSRVESQTAVESLAPGRTALVVGGTSGIGFGIALRLVQLGCSRVIIAGRNQARGEAIVAKLLEAKAPGVKSVSFQKIDASSMAEIKTFAQVFRESHARLDYLVMTQGVFSFNGFTPTVDGFDQKMAIHYYGRHLLVRLLAPLLEQTKESSQVDVRVLSVLAAAQGSAVEVDDLDLEKSFSIYRASQAAPFHNDLMVDSFSQKYPTVGFIHGCPGFVATGLLDSVLPKATKPFTDKLLQWVATSQEESGARMAATLLTPEFSTGWHLVDEMGVATDRIKQHTSEIRDILWEHTIAKVPSNSSEDAN